MSTSEPDALTQTIMENADRHVGIARKVFGLHFDFSEASITQTDEAISKFHPDGNIMDSTVLGYGSYVGETIRRNLGGVWVQDERGVALLEQIGGLDIKAFPFSWTHKRFDNGMEDSLAYKYAFLKSEVVRNGGQLPSPVDFPAATEQAEDLMEGPDLDRLGRAPILVFLLVAGVDGEISSKETLAFRKVLENCGDFSSPLLQVVIQGVTIPKIEEFISEITSGEVDALEELKGIRAVLDESYASHAHDFKGALVSIGRKIAEASGGFFGFGNKISKDEMTMIAGIAFTLGLINSEGEA